jgi:hypothetical protein
MYFFLQYVIDYRDILVNSLVMLFEIIIYYGFFQMHAFCFVCNPGNIYCH